MVCASRSVHDFKMYIIIVSLRACFAAVAAQVAQDCSSRTSLQSSTSPPNGTLKISFDSDPKCHHFLDRFKDRFGERFGSILAPSWPPKTFPRWGQVVPRGAETVLNSNHHRARAPCARLATACGLLKSTSPLASTISPRLLCFLQHPGLADLFFLKQVLIL